MDRKISIKIGTREYKLSASSPQQEEAIRLAAQTINKRLQEFSISHPGRNQVDVMSMVALNETVARIVLQKELKVRDSETEKLSGDLQRYLSGTDK
ncbi:MAG: cell division protein ZapA [Bacteroidales bacterium]|nr:cell division protein ZapA [Bacteroidales bacterium]